MKYLKLYENIDWTEDDFDFEEEEPFKVGDKVYLPIDKYSINTIHYTNIPFKGMINDKYEKRYYKRDKYGIITEIRKMKDGTPVFRLKGEWPFRKFDNWIKK